jgi:uncharacterized protein with HEPN domain
MPPRDWEIRIRDILKAVEKIIEHTASLDFKAFSSDEWTVDAVLRNLTIIGEAANRIPEEIRKQYSELPWDEMRDIRNIIVHEYFGVDLSIVWTTITQDLPPLNPKLKSMLEKELLEKELVK